MPKQDAETIDWAFKTEFVEIWEARNRLKISNTTLYTVARELASEVVGKKADDHFNDGLLGKVLYGQLTDREQVKCLGQLESPVKGVVIYYPEHDMDFSSLGVLEVIELTEKHIKVANKAITAQANTVSNAFELEISTESNSEFGFVGTFSVLDYGRVLTGKVRSIDAVDTFLWLSYWLQLDLE